MLIRLVVLVVFVFFTSGVKAQVANAVPKRYNHETIKVATLVLPTAMTAYGFAALNWNALKTFDANVRKVVWMDNPHRPFSIDNYIQYGPGLAVYGLNAAGISGKHNFRDRTIIYVMANGIMGIAVLSLKHFVPAWRPDGSANDGFPSGHAGTAFVGAEFMHREYIDRSPWYGVAGYTLGAGTGYFRMYNDKHWFSEVIAGAGIGILSAKAAYWLWPDVQRILGLRTKRKFSW